MAQPAPFTPRKLAISALMVGWLVALLWGLERKYDESDYRKVDELIVAPGAPWSLEKELLERHPNNAPRCDKALISSFRGLVRVTCAPAGEDAYRFQADLVRRRLNGEDPRSADVIAAVDRKLLAADAGVDAGAQAPSGEAAAPEKRPEADAGMDAGTP